MRSKSADRPAPATSQFIARCLCFVMVLVAPSMARAQAATADTIRACYVPATGTIYRIRKTGLPNECVASSHVEFWWIASGGANGATGATGPTGAAGATGATGL